MVFLRFLKKEHKPVSFQKKQKNSDKKKQVGCFF